MSTPDPIAEAEVLLAYGRPREAERVLREAMNRDPTRLDLRDKLKSIAAPSSNHSAGVARHLAMAWLLFGSTCVVTLGPPIALFPLLESRVDLPNPHDINPLWLILGLLIVMGPFVFAWFYLFLASWFKYLRTLPADLRRRVEDALPSVLNVAAFEPAYSRMRRRIFKDNGA